MASLSCTPNIREKSRVESTFKNNTMSSYNDFFVDNALITSTLFGSIVLITVLK